MARERAARARSGARAHTHNLQLDHLVPKLDSAEAKVHANGADKGFSEFCQGCSRWGWKDGTKGGEGSRHKGRSNQRCSSGPMHAEQPSYSPSSANLNNKQDLPTPVSPMSTSLNR